MASGEVRAAAPVRLQPVRQASGVCPPNWHDHAQHRSRLLPRRGTTSTRLEGQRLEVEPVRGVVVGDTVSGLQLTITVSNPASDSVRAACTQE